MEATRPRTLSGIGLSTAEAPLRLAFPAAVATVLVILAFVPTVFGHLRVPEDRAFSGIPGNVHDTAQYLSWMRESRDHILISNMLTPEDNPAVFLNLHWFVVGRLAGILNVSLVQMYDAFRIAAALFYSVSVYWLCGVLCPTESRRRFAVLLATFGSGLGWIWVVEKHLNQRADVLYPLDIYTTQANTLQLAIVGPHQLLALTLTIIVLGLAWLGCITKRWPLTISSALLALFLGLGHVYELVTIWTVLATLGLLLTLRDGFRWDTFIRLGAVVLVSLPAPLYFGWLSSSANPTWQRAFAQYDNLGVHTPNPLNLLVLLGLPFIGAVLGALRRVRPLPKLTNRDVFLLAWFVANIPILYLPIRFEIMLLAGFQVVMAVLAADWVHDAALPWLIRHVREASRHSKRRLATSVAAVLLVLTLPANLYLLGWRIKELSAGEYPLYLRTSDIVTMKELDRQEKGSVVMSSFETGHFIPGFTGQRSFLSSAVMTLDYVHKREIVNGFFDRHESDEWRQEIVREYGVDFVFYGPAERSLGGFDPTTSPHFERLFDGGQTQLFRVIHE